MSNLKRSLPGLLALAVGLAIWAGCETSCKPPTPALPPLPPASLKPAPGDPRIAHVAARLLEEYHYSQRPLDADLSKEFFTNYLNALDPRHENFLQSDIAEFDIYRTNLDRLTINRGLADLTPAFAIFNRYTERVQEHNQYVYDLLKKDKFRFNVPDEKILIDRRKAPFPKDLNEAKDLWRQRLRYEYLQEKLALEISETNNALVVKLPPNASKEITEKLQRRYRWNLHSITNWDSSSVLAAYLNALANSFDPHSDYFSAPKAQDFSIGMNLSLFGIGAQLYEDDGYCTIRSLVPGGPAAKSKQINEKDRIIAVAQGDKPPVDVVDMELEKVVQQIRGAKNTEVRLTISPVTDRSARKVVTLIRDEIKLEDAEAKARLLEIPDGNGNTNRIGIIDLPSFYATVNLGNNSQTTPKSTTADVAKLIKRLKEEKISGLIIDLRSNPGGSLEEAIRFTGLFIKDGPIVLARDPAGHVQVDSDPDPEQLYDGPLVVMVNRFSASASEIAAGALQDYGRALIVGDISTHGKGTVQNLNPLKQWIPAATNDPGTLKITIKKFYRVSGASTQKEGVTPDIVLPDVLNHSTIIGEANLDNALPWDTIQPASYDRLNLVQPFLPSLRARSNERITTNQDFRYVHQDIAQFQKAQADKTAPINEREAIKDRERIFKQNKARDAERAARKPDGIKAYEITVKNADQPGLQEAGATNTASTATSNADTNKLGTVTGNTSSTNTIKSAAADKPAPPPFDPMLDETRQILLDYIPLLKKSGGLMAHQ